MYSGIFLAALCSLSAVSAVPLIPEDAKAISTSGCIYKKPRAPVNLPAIMIPMNSMGDIDDKGMCNDTMFLDVAKGCKAVTALINGFPSPEKIKAFKICAKMLDDHNVDIFGYVSTKIEVVDQETGIRSEQGMRAVTAIEGDMKKWLGIMKGLSGFKGFFLDNVSNYYGATTENSGLDPIKWYRQLVNISRTLMKNARIILNPGGFTDVRLLNRAPSYPVPAGYVVGFLNKADQWSPPGGNCLALLWDKTNGSYNPGPWCPIVPELDGADPFISEVERKTFKTIALVYSAPKEFLDQSVTAVKNGFEYFYATDAKLNENPWSHVPSYWTAHLEMLENGEEKEPFDPNSPWRYVPLSGTSSPTNQTTVADAITTSISHITTTSTLGNDMHR